MRVGLQAFLRLLVSDKPGIFLLHLRLVVFLHQETVLYYCIILTDLKLGIFIILLINRANFTSWHCKPSVMTLLIGIRLEHLPKRAKQRKTFSINGIHVLFTDRVIYINPAAHNTKNTLELALLPQRLVLSSIRKVCIQLFRGHISYTVITKLWCQKSLLMHNPYWFGYIGYHQGVVFSSEFEHLHLVPKCAFHKNQYNRYITLTTGCW